MAKVTSQNSSSKLLILHFYNIGDEFFKPTIFGIVLSGHLGYL